MHYYSHHIGDFIKATARLSDSQAMAYLRILWLYYDKDGIIEHDIEQIAFEVGSDPKTVELIIKTYFKIEGNFIKQYRCDKEIAGYLKKSTGGKEGANKRWNNKDSDSLPNGLPNADAMPTQCDPNANQEPITNNQEPVLKTVGVAKATKATRLKIESIPEDWYNFCRSERPDLNPITVWDHFRDHWVSVPGQKGCKLDWFATWRNWVRNQWSKPQDMQDKRRASQMKTLAGLTSGIHGANHDAIFKPITETKTLETIDMERSNANLLG